MSDHTFCGVPAGMRGGAGPMLCQWPVGHRLTWTVVGELPNFTRDDLVDVYRQAWQLWTDVCGLRTEYVTSAARANVLVGSRRIDGGAGILAEAELPCGNVTPRDQRRVWMDRSERWIVAENPPPGRVDLLRVSAHEFGHSIGLGHNQDSRPGNALMDPSISGIRSPQAWDIAQAVERYLDPEDDSAGGEPGGDFQDLLREVLECLERMTPEQQRRVEQLLRAVSQR